MIVNVTKKHIAHGTRRNLYRCAVAIAITDATGLRCEATPEVLTIGDDFECPTPDKVARFIEAFDTGHHVDPFSFRMRKPR